MHWAAPWANRAASLVLLVVLLVSLASGCGGRRILGFGRGRDGVLLVRHTQLAPLEISAGEESLGFAEPSSVTCFREAPTGSIRFEARRVGGGELMRAHTIMLPPEQPLLWDIDHNEVLNGRAHAGLCG